MRYFYCLIFLLFSSTSFAGSSFCEQLNQSTQDLNWHRPYIGEVIGSKRLYFYSAPDKKCKIDKLFIIKSDTVSIYSSHGKYSQISYSGRTDDNVAWVLSKQLKIIAKPDEPFVP